MWSMCAGHIGRLAGPVFTAKQSSESPHLDSMQVVTLQLLIDIVKHAPPRDIVVAGPPQPVVRVYSDASFEQGVLRLGWIIFHPDHPPTGGTCIVPQSTLDSWKTRNNKFIQGKLYPLWLSRAFIHIYSLQRMSCGSSIMKRPWPA